MDKNKISQIKWLIYATTARRQILSTGSQGDSLECSYSM